MKYLFVLGKNPILSMAEIYHYLKNRKIDFEFVQNFENILEVETENDISKIIDSLGGSIKLAVPCNLDDIFRKDKIRIGLSVYPRSKSKYKKIMKEMVKISRENNSKITFSSPKFHGHTELKHFEVLNLLKRGGTEIIYFDSKFYTTVGVHNPFDFKHRDIERPRQRPIYSIPPRLARIMVNLTALPGQKLLDPFCGIGTILQEALISGMEVFGLDKNKNCLKDAKINLNWLGFEKFHLIEGDATQLSRYINEKIDGIVTEPYLGPPLKSNPTDLQAHKILKNIEILFENFLSESKKILKNNSRICIVSPLFVTRSNKIKNIDMTSLADKIGLKVVSLLPGHVSIVDAEDRHKTKREIWLLEK
ncbi:MAG: methyltransferase domain-containing protein [candidate division WOR-3 bacterium]